MFLVVLHCNLWPSHHSMRIRSTFATDQTVDPRVTSRITQAGPENISWAFDRPSNSFPLSPFSMPNLLDLLHGPHFEEKGREEEFITCRHESFSGPARALRLGSLGSTVWPAAKVLLIHMLWWLGHRLPEFKNWIFVKKSSLSHLKAADFTQIHT